MAEFPEEVYLVTTRWLRLSQLAAAAAAAAELAGLAVMLRWMPGCSTTISSIPISWSALPVATATAATAAAATAAAVETASTANTNGWPMQAKDTHTRSILNDHHLTQ